METVFVPNDIAHCRMYQRLYRTRLEALTAYCRAWSVVQMCRETSLDPSDDGWVQEMLADGWIFGAPTHDYTCVVPLTLLREAMRIVSTEATQLFPLGSALRLCRAVYGISCIYAPGVWWYLGSPWGSLNIVEGDPEGVGRILRQHDVLAQAVEILTAHGADQEVTWLSTSFAPTTCRSRRGPGSDLDRGVTAMETILVCSEIGRNAFGGCEYTTLADTLEAACGAWLCGTTGDAVTLTVDMISDGWLDPIGEDEGCEVEWSAIEAAMARVLGWA